MSTQSTSIASYSFERDYPTIEGARTVYDDQDLLRAVEAYRFFYPTVSAEGLFQGARDLGIADGRGLLLLATQPHHVVFTANSDTPYASATLDLGANGPMVIDLPAGPYIALADDHHQRWILDMGLPGPDGGSGGKYVILPPGYRGDVPAQHHVGQSHTYKVLLAMRALPIGGDLAGAMNALRQVKVYPLANPDGVLPYVDVTQRAMDSTPLRWEDNLEFWTHLHAIIDAEPVLDEFRPMYGVLAALGLQKGRPFRPDARVQRILETAARRGIEQMRVEGFANQRPDRMVWPDRRWEWVSLVADDPNFETKGYLDLQARERWFVQAIVTSPAMFRRKVGFGSLYFLTARDASGAFLDGGRTYKLTVPGPVPAKLFWSVTAYDAKTRSQVRTPQNKAVLGSLQDQLEPRANGAIDLYFGPVAPAGKEKSWIQTAPDHGYFLYLRIYGPEGPSLDGTWQPGDVTALEDVEEERPPAARVSASVISSISTPDLVESRIGRLELANGIPTEQTSERIYEELDHLHATETFLSAYQAVSLYAMRRGFFEVGVRDNDVLLFSQLMDSRSLFLTANCDTPYFFSFLDLEQGPVVLEVPRDVLGVVDDMWFRWIVDIGLAGPDRGAGGRYLFVPPGYAGPLPEGGFTICRSTTYHALVLGRTFLENDDPRPAVSRIRNELRIYPYVPGGPGSSVSAFLRGESAFVRALPNPKARFVEGSGLEMNTIPPNDVTFYVMLHAMLQLEPAEAMDPEIAGHFAALGIMKGRRFPSDERTRRILERSIEVGNTMARTLSFRPRDELGFAYYGAGSRWTNPLFAAGYEFLRPPPVVENGTVTPSPNPGARTLDARSCFFYIATGITPAMCMRLPDIGSQYVGAFFDRASRPLDGARTYTLRLPPNIPARRFWSFTLYDNQTRSMLQTPQRYPRAGSQAYPTPAAVPDEDGATTLVLGPVCPGNTPEGNFVQTVPNKSYFAILRLYSPLASFFDKTWRPGEIEPVRPVS